jgi:hypothetical protein
MQAIFGDLAVIFGGLKMALHLLSAREEQTVRDGDFADGGGLILRVRGTHATWVFRYSSPDGRRRDMGFGAVPRDSLDAIGESMRRARKRARDARDALDAGIDPIEKKRTDRKAVAATVAAAKSARKAEAATLSRVAREYHARVLNPPPHWHSFRTDSTTCINFEVIAGSCVSSICSCTWRLNTAKAEISGLPLQNRLCSGIFVHPSCDGPIRNSQ